jgi:curved DNA-binding protein CbpA
MSSSVSGKFQDHYVILGIEPKADAQAIQAAYAKLAQKYESNNADTANANKFEAINLAYEVLSDPVLRIEFDKLKGVDHEEGNPTFAGADFFRTLEQSAVLRSVVLCILYDRRRVNAFKASLSRRHLENMLHVTADQLNFALWYLKKRALVINDDKSSMEITVDGMDYLEQKRPSAEAILPLIRQEAFANQQALANPAPKAEKPGVPEIKTAEEKAAEPVLRTAEPVLRTAEPVLNVLNRALQRSLASESAQHANKK